MQKAVQLAPINAMIAVTALAIAVMMNMFTYRYILIDIMPRYRALSQTIDHSHRPLGMFQVLHYTLGVILNKKKTIKGSEFRDQYSARAEKELGCTRSNETHCISSVQGCVSVQCSQLAL